MKVAIDASPLKNGHKTRGIGSYTYNLVNSLKNADKDVEIEQFYGPHPPLWADIIHYPYFDLFFHTLPASSRVPRVVTIHDLIPLVFPKYFPSGIKGRINLFRQKKALRNTDAVICDSETSKADIIKKLSYPAHKIHVIYLAQGNSFKQIIDDNLLAKAAKKYLLPEKFILYVGDVNWNKNIPNLLKAIKLSETNLVATGSALADKNLEQTKEIDQLIKKLGIDKRVRILGYVPESDLLSLYNLAQATILPSFYEGFGLPILESMACATPVICSNNSSLAEIAGNAAIYCNPNDHADISKKILKVLKLSSEEKEKLKKELLHQASKFSWAKTAMETIRVYKNLAK